MSGVKGSYMNRILEQKRIDTLYHFTRTENLENIFQYGIIPREVLDRREELKVLIMMSFDMMIVLMQIVHLLISKL